MKKISYLIFSLIIFGFAGKSLLFNFWDLMHQRLPNYHINASLLSGALLLYDRPMFFENRYIEIKERSLKTSTTYSYDLSAGPYQTYLERRLFRMATGEFPCGADRAAAFNELFCKPYIQILRNKAVESVKVKFKTHFQSGDDREFNHQCYYEK